MATLLYLIIHVLLGSAQEEVIWIAAARIVAAVTNHYPLGDWAVGQFVGYTVHPLNLAIDADTAVTVVGQCALPFVAVALSEGARNYSVFQFS